MPSCPHPSALRASTSIVRCNAPLNLEDIVGGASAISDGGPACVCSPEVPIDVDAPSIATIAGHRGQENDSNISNVWNYGFKVGQGFRCGYCGFIKKYGGKTQLREHLGRVLGEVRSCEKALSQVQEVIMKAYKLGKIKRKESKDFRKERDDRHLEEVGGVPGNNVPNDEEAQVRIAMERSLRDIVHGNRSNRKDKESVQPRIDIAMKVGTIEQLGQAWAKWFHENDIAGLKADCPYFRAAMRLTQQLGETARLFNGSDIDGRFLEANYQEVGVIVEGLKRDWKQYGVTVMCDSWIGQAFMSIINFMVHCNRRVFFHKSINASAEIQNSNFLYKEIKKVVVDEIGHEHVVHIITDNGANYKKACAKLIEEYPHIVWQPCAAHTINLMLKDIGTFSEVDDVVSSARRITKFFQSHN